ncbi:Glycosyltransferase 61 [Trypanosoma melophagium]|uniref:Glycosyltransferase 61 n=1 Tax=Trypanosoma melophagium TaxID=715481 RepID=UPI00351A65B5|nr:Glycosyltransferase 61 [Trypanosoma melophagium]
MSSRVRGHRKKPRKLTSLWVLFPLILLLMFIILSLLIQGGMVSPEPKTADATARTGRGLPPELFQAKWGRSPEVVQALSIVKERLEAFPKQVEARLKMVPAVGNLNRSCHFVYPLNRKIRRYEYASGFFRKHSIETPEWLLNVVKQQYNDDVFILSGALPVMIKQSPVVLSKSFNITQPFGKWKAFFRDSTFTYVTLPVDSDSVYSDKLGHGERMRLVRKLYPGAQYQPPQPPMYVVAFPNAVVSVGHVITCGGNVYTAGGCLRHWYLPAINKSEQIGWRDVVVPICDEWCRGYFHFTHDHLLRLATVYKVLMEREDAVLVIQSRFRGFQKQWLTDVLGIPSSRILYSKLPVHGRLVLYPIPETCGGLFSHLLYAMRAIVFERLHLTPLLPINERKLHFFFAERKGLSRMPSNYYGLKKEIMREYKDMFVFGDNAAGDINVSEQVRAFQQADIVLGPHGANLANVMWMRSGTHLIEFMAYSYGNMCYYNTASRVNVTHHAILHRGGKDTKYTLDYAYLKRHIDFAINSFKKSQ